MENFANEKGITKIKVFFFLSIAIFASLLMMALYAEGAPKRIQGPSQESIGLLHEFMQPLNNIAASIEKIYSKLSQESKYPSWLTAFGPWFTGAVALTLAFWMNFIIPWWRKPKLELVFKEDKYEYARKIFFGAIGPKFRDKLISSEPIVLKKPGFNSRVKIINSGRSVAKNVQARLESVVCKDMQHGLPPIIYYHPSAVKWSGEKRFNKVDIAPLGSFFFLDLVYSINESYDQILKSYDGRTDIPWGMLQKEDYSGDVYWAVWVDRSYERGIPDKYRGDGSYELNYLIFAENCKPIQFTAYISWYKSEWDNPKISIKKGAFKREK